MLHSINSVTDSCSMLPNGLKSTLRSKHHDHEGCCYAAIFNCVGKRLRGLEILLRSLPGSNRPFYSCRLSDLASDSEWQRGWS